MAGYEVNDASGEIAGVEDLVEIADQGGTALTRDRDDGVADGDRGEDEREQAEKRSVIRSENADGADSLLHGQRHHAEGRVVHGALILVGPGSVCKGALDGVVELNCGLVRPDESRELGDDLGAALNEVLCDVVEDLGTGVRGRLGHSGRPADRPR